MDLSDNSIHPLSETNLSPHFDPKAPIEIDTFDGKVHVQWDPDANVTPLGQLPFFIQFLKLGKRFEPWVQECPLNYQSNNASSPRDILGSLFLSILSGHTRYAHICSLMHDSVNQQLLGMTKVVSDDTARRALKNIDELAGMKWLQSHLFSCYEPLLTVPWILDVDVTIKPLYGHQEAAVKGYNHHKPGRPCHTLHTYMIGNLRLILDVEVQAGNQGSSSHSLPGLIQLLDKLPLESRPKFIRGDCDWGTDTVMNELEQKQYHYLFKMKKTDTVKALIARYHGGGQWTTFKEGWEAKEAELKLSTWDETRRVVLVRRQLHKVKDLTLEHQRQGRLDLSFIGDAEDLKAFEYSVLVTNLNDEMISIVQHYRDRADCENNFDELKNQWGWGGYTTKKVKSCRFISRIMALVYNWWTLYVRLLHPENHLEAITSRPLLLSSVGRLTQSGRQKKLYMTSSHQLKGVARAICNQALCFLNQLKVTAPQLSISECWKAIIDKIIALINVDLSSVKRKNVQYDP